MEKQEAKRVASGISPCKLYKSLWNVPCVEREKKKKEKDGNGKGSETKERNENRVNEVAGKRKHSRSNRRYFLHVSIETISFFFSRHE